ncbi:ATP synthase subunit I [Desertibacillus haloalkaliphilus]|uniref:ATP synthase subunit I n=1 Tax=Desertibacillus haloalkaliphilus TaxID=1328930 RepID=UPI001C2613EC|nr:ATP synthase subunit I [Desertibacillus haloalkaliphilus]MBU8905883.1 ATP synthase subunit I [Desertibacillus haloalkaliphilus]
MDQYAASMRRYVQYMLYVVALFVLGWGFTPYDSMFLGLILGSAFSFYNLWSMYTKMKQLGQAATGEKKVYSIGTLSRFAVGALAAIIAIRYPETFHLVGVIIGLMLTYIIILIDSLLQIRRL